VKNLHVGRERPHLLRQGGAKLLLDFHGVVAFCDADPIGDAQHMAVDGKARHPQRMAEHDVRRFSADAGQLRQQLHVRGHFTTVVSDEALRGSDECFPFLIEKSRRPDEWFEIGRRRVGECTRIGVLLEERGRHHVHAHVGRLRGEDGRHQQLERVPIMQLRIGVRMLLRECFNDSPRRLR
jgi:hypothetical protein